MNLYSGGTNKKLKVNLGGKTYKIMDPVIDYAKLVKAGMNINEIPEVFKEQVQALIDKQTN